MQCTTSSNANRKSCECDQQQHGCPPGPPHFTGFFLLKHYGLVFAERLTAAIIAFLHFLAFAALHTLIVVECHCGSNGRSQRDGQAGGKWRHLVDTTEKTGGSVAEMYGASPAIPELIPPSGPPRQAGPAGQYNPGHPQVNGHHGGEPNPQRLGQRAPKLGQIGRSKKVDLEDEDLEDIMNNNGQCQVSLAPCS